MRVVFRLFVPAAALAACVLGAAWLPAGVKAGSVAPRAPRPAASLSCKPQGPVALVLDALDPQDGAGGRIELAFALRPVRELLSLEWELQLPADAVALQGALAGEAATGAGVPSEGLVALDLPVDGGSRRARLVARGSFAGSGPDGLRYPEAFEVSQSLHWGQPAVSAPRVPTAAADAAAPVEVLALPVAHRLGR